MEVAEQSVVEFTKHFNQRAQLLLKRNPMAVELEIEELWAEYLNAFPEGTNEVFKERQAHDCNNCKKTLRNYGTLVNIDSSGNIHTIWEVENAQYPYDEVCKKLDKFVKKQFDKNLSLYPFVISDRNDLGCANNKAMIDDKVVTFSHMYVKPVSNVILRHDSIGSKLGQYNSSLEVFKNSLSSINTMGIETVLDLINQNSIYRGQEHKATVEKFRDIQKSYTSMIADDATPSQMVGLLHLFAEDVPTHIKHIKNSSIGTLLVNVSEGMDLDVAVKKFETIMAPANYKRPKPVVTQKMIIDAQKKVDELSLSEALDRRHATITDVNINDVLFTDVSIKKAMNVFDELKENTPTNPKSFAKVQEIGVKDFLKNVLPSAQSIEVMIENTHKNNLMSIIAPNGDTESRLFKWNNSFSWTYANNMTDGIKERVKNAGGNIDATVRCSLSWDNSDDLDIHMKKGAGHLYYGHKIAMGAELDVDANAGRIVSNPVENIFFKNTPADGKYEFIVHNYTKRTNDNPGFTIQLDIDGNTQEFSYDEAVKPSQSIKIGDLVVKDGISIFKVSSSVKSSTKVEEVWKLHTNTWEKVNFIMKSPNHWGDEAVGNEHLFFIINKAHNPDAVRPFFNEFLKEELLQYKRVFELLGNNSKIQPVDNQLSGVGFSSTKKDSVLIRVKGTSQRVLKIKF